MKQQLDKISAKGLKEEAWVSRVFGRPMEESEQPKVIVKKGGPTSGNFGHLGRPGKIGGSAPAGVTFATHLNDLSSGSRSGYIIDPEGRIIDTFYDDHSIYIRKIIRKHPDTAVNYLGLSQSEVDGIINSEENSFYMFQSMEHKVYDNGFVRVRHAPNELNIQVGNLDTATLRKLQKLADDGKLEHSKYVVVEGVLPDNWYFSRKGITGDTSKRNAYVSGTWEDFLSSKRVIWDEVEYSYMFKEVKKSKPKLPYH